MSVGCTSRRAFLRSLAALSIGAVPGPIAAATRDPSRVALVVGNDAYPAAPLANAVNDANAVAALLEKAGFGVERRVNATRSELVAAAGRYVEAAARSEISLALFYYAGHGAQLDWRNYLLPVDARVDTASDLPAQGVDMGSLLVRLGRAKGRSYVVILDACRDNPFGPSFRPSQPGLSQFDAPPGGLLAFSTAPGSVAADAATASGRAGLYTENLVRELSVPATRLEDALKRVRLAVRVASRGAQIPWESTSLETDVFLFPSGRRLTEAEIESALERELASWNRVKGSKNIDDWIVFLREWPSGRFAEVAQSRLSHFAARDEGARLAARIAAAATPLPAIGSAPSVTLAAAALADAPPREPASVVAAAAPAAPAVAISMPPAAPVPSATSILDIAPGRPVPALMRPSANPNSAGTYVLGRRFEVGDRVVYQRSDPVYGGERETVDWRVTGVDLDGDRVELNDGFIVLDSMGNPLVWDGVVYEPRFQAVPSEFQLGKRWTTRYVASRAGQAPFEAYYDYVIAARERIRLPFGEVETFRVDGEGFQVRSGQRLTIQHWLVPGVNYSLRTDNRRYDARSLRVVRAELREMVSCRQVRWAPA